jgi:hypothetical protein
MTSRVWRRNSQPRYRLRAAAHEPCSDRGSLYLAQVRRGWVEVYRDDSVRVDAFDVPFGVNPRRELVQHGWRPTGHPAVGGGGWAAILVEPAQST